MLSDAFYEFYYLLTGLFGYVNTSPPDMVDLWLTLFSLIATIAVLLLPFYIVYKVVRWLSA